MVRRVNIGQLREPINLISRTLIDDGLGGFIQDGPESTQEVFSSWKQMNANRKYYLGLDVNTNYFEVIIRSINLSSIAYIERNSIKYSIQKKETSQNLGGPEMLILTISEWQA